MPSLPADAVDEKVFDINMNELSDSNYKLRVIRMSKAIMNMFIYFCKRYNLPKDVYTIDIPILLDMCDRYFRDVIRLKYFHPTILRIDRHKIAGYVTYWICKLHPIRVCNREEYDKNKESALTVNEIFAIYAACGRINSYFIKSNLSSRIKLNGVFSKDFIYDLRYRPINGDSLSLTYYLIENCLVS